MGCGTYVDSMMLLYDTNHDGLYHRAKFAVFKRFQQPSAVHEVPVIAHSVKISCVELCARISSGFGCLLLRETLYLLKLPACLHCHPPSLDHASTLQAKSLLQTNLWKYTGRLYQWNVTLHTKLCGFSDAHIHSYLQLIIHPSSSKSTPEQLVS